MTAILFGKSVFVGLIKDVAMRSSWISHIEPKSNDKYPYKRHTEEMIDTEEKAT